MLAPKLRTMLKLRFEAVAITSMPDADASWTTMAPTSEAPSSTRIVLLVGLGGVYGRDIPRWFFWYSPAAASATGRGRVAAWSKLSLSGMAETIFSDTTVNWWLGAPG